MNVFIAGPRAISALDKAVNEKLHSIYVNNHTVLVGDANGVDKAVQKYFANLRYGDVIVYACEGKTRNNAGCWDVQIVDVPAHVKGFDYYKIKDKAMADDAEYGFMIWNGESKGTLNNMINLLSANKSTLIYLTKTSSFYETDSMEKLQRLIMLCGQDTQKTFDKLRKTTAPIAYQQVSLF